MTAPPDRTTTVTAVAEAVLSHPSVLRLDAGPFGSITSHLPGRSLAGVRMGVGAEPTEIAVVVVLDVPFARLADEIAERVRTVLGPVAVEVTFADVGVAHAPVPPSVQAPPAPTGPAGLT